MYSLKIYVIEIIISSIPSGSVQFPVLGGLIKEYTESNL